MKPILLGAFVGTGVALAYLILSPGFLGIPDGIGANIILAPGIFVGMFCVEALDAPRIVGQVAGVVTMGLVGGALGAVAGWLLGRRYGSR